MNEFVYDFTDFKEGNHFTLAFKSKLLLFSPDGSLVELGLIKINKLNNQPIEEDKLAFVKNSGNGLNIYFNYKNLPKPTAKRLLRELSAIVFYTGEFCRKNSI